MARELEELREALLRAIHSSPTAAQRVAEVLSRTGMPYAALAWTKLNGNRSTSDHQLASLVLLRVEHPAEFADLERVAATTWTPRRADTSPAPTGHGATASAGTSPGDRGRVGTGRAAGGPGSAKAGGPGGTEPGHHPARPTEPPAAEPRAGEPGVAEAGVAKARTTEPPAAEAGVAEPPAAEPGVAEALATELPVAEAPAAEPSAAEPPAAEPRVAGDHVDLRDGTFLDQVVAVQHLHYGNVPAPADWRPAGSVRPLEFGVQPTRPVPGLPDVPPYVPRDCDADLSARLARTSLVLILGERLAGTSYTAWHAVHCLDGHRVYIPVPGEDLRPLAAALRGNRGRYVVWLDDLTGHLGPGGLDLPLLGRLADLGAVVLATMSPAEYYRRRTGTAPGDRVVAAARTVTLPRDWSKAELARLSACDDPRAYPAYMWSGTEGVASYFAVGHLLFDEWRRPGTRQDHPLGGLLVRTAVDVARSGVTAGIPDELFVKVLDQYGQERDEALRTESYEEAITWATAPMFGVSGLLVEGEERGTWRAYGALVAEALASEDLEPVPDGVWWTLLDAAESAALDHGAILGAARAALSARVEAGDTELMFGLALRTEGEESEALLRRAADAGHAGATAAMALTLSRKGNEEEALPYLEAAAEQGYAWAARELGRVHRAHAERWLRKAAEAGDGAAAHELGDMLVGPGRDGEALRWYRKAAAAGHREVAGSLGTLLANWNEAEAEEWLRYGTAWGDPRATNEFGLFLEQARKATEAETEALYRRAAEGGDTSAMINLGITLEHLGRNEEARSWYLKGHECAAPYAERHLARLLRKQGEVAEAEEWERKAAVADPRGLPGTLPPPPPVTSPADTSPADTSPADTSPAATPPPAAAARPAPGTPPPHVTPPTPPDTVEE
ncbi:hypothetical protein JK359_09035 [Streptomyces actinomycinicus]|uniref:Sel1 repeat family protein n=1 Tax=Streptomyces actinomycinicus TaxID=1695166 RepID=A0A937EH17_9ACTN|nr:tetratricopeptide repeat protein [Streptomyces actinomycinicus]MBL1082125.1 hypothetical protein [Streptomyces actinomycinicus]